MSERRAPLKKIVIAVLRPRPAKLDSYRFDAFASIPTSLDATVPSQGDAVAVDWSFRSKAYMSPPFLNASIQINHPVARLLRIGFATLPLNDIRQRRLRGATTVLLRLLLMLSAHIP